MTVETADVVVQTPEGSFSAYVATPERPNGVGVVVLQEIFGVNANVRAIVRDLAETGYSAIAPDLFWRQAPGLQLDPSSDADRERAMALMKGLDRDQSIADAAAALNSLRTRDPEVRRSAAIGYCYGGGVAYLMATRGVVEAGVAYYGTGLHTLLSELDQAQGRVLLHIAGDDYLCPPDAQHAIVQAAAADGRAKVTIHPGVGHAFARVGGSAFDADAANRANTETMALLESLKPS